MKVLERRTAFEDWTKEVTCNGVGWDQREKTPCGSLLEINKEDLMKRKWYKYPEREGIDIGYVCPICGCFSVVENISQGLVNIVTKDYKDLY